MEREEFFAYLDKLVREGYMSAASAEDARNEWVFVNACMNNRLSPVKLESNEGDVYLYWANPLHGTLRMHVSPVPEMAVDFVFHFIDEQGESQRIEMQYQKGISDLPAQVKAHLGYFLVSNGN